MINISKPFINDEEKKLVLETLESGIISQGPRVAQLEEEFCLLTKSRYALATNNGTSALHAALYGIGIKEGDEVITTPFTFVATANSILMCNAKPVFADIEKETFNIDATEIEKRITPRTKAIIGVDLYGQLADYEKIEKIAKKYSLKVLEDAAQSIGAEYKGRKSGNFGDITTFSLYATKNLTAGEGGMITTNNKDYTDRIKSFRHHGQDLSKHYDYISIGYNYRMSDLHAALALPQLKHLEQFTKKRREIAARYSKAFANIKGLVTPYANSLTSHVYHQYTLRITPEFKSSRDELAAYLKDKGIQSVIYYPKPLHLYPHFAYLGYKGGDFPIAEKAAGEVLSIPVHPQLTDEEISYIINTITNYV